MRWSWILYFAASSYLLGSVGAGNILVVLPLPMYSHTMPFVPLFRALADKGHNVTFASPLVNKLTIPNFNNLNINFTLETLTGKLKTISGSLKGFWYEFFGSWKFCPKMTELCLPPTLDILPPRTAKFDLIIAEGFFCQQPLVGLGHYYGSPVIFTHPGPVTPTVAYHTGNPNAPSYLPNVRTPLTDRMKFWDRLKNSAMAAVELLLNKLYALNYYDKIMREWLKEPDLPYIEDLLNNVSLVVIDTSFTLNYARPYAKNILEVGGLSVKVAEPLPDDLEKFISEAEHGVIYFSLGSLIDGSGQEKLLRNVMESFRYVKQRVLFKSMRKFEFHDVPKNVLVRPWFPQPSILNHKNVVLFISHGGLNSIHEAAYHGVPVLGIPFYVDQPHNILLLQEFGMGLYLDYERVTDPIVMVNAVMKILNNPSYREVAKRRSELVKDRPIPILDEAVYWVEYVMRYKGAPHLRPASVHLPWYQLLLIDIIGLILAVFLSVIIILSFIVRVCNKILSKAVKSEKKGHPHTISREKKGN